MCEQRFRLIADSMTDYAVCALDANGSVRSWNTGAERLLGYLDPEIVGQSYSRFFTREDLLTQLPERLLEQARFSGKAAEEGSRVRKGGGRFRTKTAVFPLKNSEGAAAGYLLVIRDMTQLFETREALLRAQADASRPKEV